MTGAGMPPNSDEVPAQADVTPSQVIVTSLAAGFALCVQPVSAQTIATDADGLTAGEVKIPTGTGDIPAYRAAPSAGGWFPVVLVVQEIFGVHEYVRDVCRRFARLGYMAIAPEMFARQGDVSKIPEIKDLFPIVRSVPDAQAMADLDAAVAWAGGAAGDIGRLGITGFCWGGRIAWLYAAHNPGLKAGVAWYGRLTGDVSALQPRHPVDVAAQLHAPVLGLYGGEDAGIPPGDVDRMRAALQQSKAAAEIVVYPQAPHAFHSDFRPSYRPAEAADGWQRMLAWFRRNGVV